MLKVGLTGGIASGKSVVGEMFAGLGVQLILADDIAHALMQPGQAVYDEVVRQFGKGILNGDGSVNRPRLAEIAFTRPTSGPSRVGELNRIVHPAVIRRQNEWMDEVGHRNAHVIAMVEAALILEAGAAERFDRLIVVTCREDQRVERLAERLKITLERARSEVSRRMAAQWPDEEKVKAADYVIDNSGSLDRTREQVHQLYSKLKEEAERKS